MRESRSGRQEDRAGDGPVQRLWGAGRAARQRPNPGESARRGAVPQPDREADLLRLIASDPWRMACLEAVAALGLPDCWIGAGFVRTPVWDRLHGYDAPTPLPDIDVIYFRPGDGPDAEAAAEAALAARLPGEPWSVRNQARMHRRNGDTPYRDTADALTHWLETPTAVAVRLDPGAGLQLLAPLGLDDLFAMVIRPTPHARARRLAAFRARLAAKDWRGRWPKCRVMLCEM